MKNITAIILVLCSVQLAGQEKLNSKDIAPYSYRFNIDDGQLAGAGAEVLIKEIESSQFFLIGEYHSDKGISNFISALLPLLSHAGYDNFVIETGPLSAQYLKSLQNSDIEKCLFDLYENFKGQAVDIPFPFFENKSDVEFLELALAYDFDIWGVDQEFLGGYQFLLETYWSDIDEPEELFELYTECRNRLIDHYATFAKNEKSEIYNLILDDNDLQASLKELTAKGGISKHNLDEEILESCRIYRDWSTNLVVNLENRTSLMKSHFLDYYRNDPMKVPKVLVKMGGMHTQRGYTGNADYELGNMLHELAIMNGTNDVNIGFETRFYYDEEEKDSIGDNLTYKSDWTDQMRPLLELGDMYEWTLIDLKPIKRMWINRERKIPSQIKSLIKGKDYIIIMPAIDDASPIFIEQTK